MIGFRCFQKNPWLAGEAVPQPPSWKQGPPSAYYYGLMGQPGDVAGWVARGGDLERSGVRKAGLSSQPQSTRGLPPRSSVSSLTCTPDPRTPSAHVGQSLPGACTLRPHARHRELRGDQHARFCTCVCQLHSTPFLVSVSAA